MKKHPHLQLIGIITVLFTLALSTRAQNLINNGDFESWNLSTKPDNWSLFRDVTATEVSGTNSWDGSAVELGIDGSDVLSALTNDISTDLTDGFFFSWEFAQEDPGGSRGMHLSFRDGTTQVLSVREFGNQIEIYDGITWQGVTGSTVSDSDFSTSTLNVYRIEIAGRLSDAQYDFSLYNITGGGNTPVTSQQNLSYWHTPPTGKIFDEVYLERGRSGSDYRVDNVIVAVPEPGTLALVTLAGLAGLLVVRRHRQD